MKKGYIFRNSIVKKAENGEVIERPWLIYSESSDKVYCYYCKLFDNSDTALATSGFNNWSNIHTRLEEHEKSKKHLHSTLNCYELHQRLSTGLTVDKENEKLIRQQTKRWNQVLSDLLPPYSFWQKGTWLSAGLRSKLEIHTMAIFLVLSNYWENLIQLCKIIYRKLLTKTFTTII